MTTTPADTSWLDKLLTQTCKTSALIDRHAESATTAKSVDDAGKAWLSNIEQAKAAILNHLQEHERLARINTAQYIQDNFVSPAGGYCDEIAADAIPNYIAQLAAPDTKQEPSPQQQEEQ